MINRERTGRFAHQEGKIITLTHRGNTGNRAPWRVISTSFHLLCVWHLTDTIHCYCVNTQVQIGEERRGKTVFLSFYDQ